jgi:hypothetical protein
MIPESSTRAGALLGLLLAGCHGGVPAKGRSSVEILGSPGQIVAAKGTSAPVVETGERIDYVPVRAKGPLREPDYPAGALTAGAGDYLLYITFTVDDRGRVTDVAPSWDRVRLPSRFEDEFLVAAKAAMATWELDPARQVYYRRAAGGEDEYLRTETVAQRMEIKLVFEAPGRMR